MYTKADRLSVSKLIPLSISVMFVTVQQWSEFEVSGWARRWLATLADVDVYHSLGPTMPSGVEHRGGIVFGECFWTLRR